MSLPFEFNVNSLSQRIMNHKGEFHPATSNYELVRIYKFYTILE